jgi:hypothetical protein
LADFFRPVNKQAKIGWKAAFIIHAAAAALSFFITEATCSFCGLNNGNAYLEETNIK